MEQRYHKEAIHVQKIELIVKDLNRSLDFYVNSLGFSVKEQSDSFAILTCNHEDELIRLEENKGADPIDKQLGIYHFAILLPSRKALSKFLHHVINRQIPITGAADHLVSEAIYLQDPDGIGIEISRDRSDSEWYGKNHVLKMDTLAFDYSGVYYEALDEAPFEKLPKDTVVGHLHLQVKDLRNETRFYEEILGFHIMNDSFPDAVFMSDNEYHHHLAINSWNTNGQVSKSANALGLKSFSIQYPTCEKIISAIEKLHQNGCIVEETANGFFSQDFEGNRLYLELIH